VFLVNSSEDYVDVAKAKGLPDRIVQQRYILRRYCPISSPIRVDHGSLWQEAIILETIFSIAGVGSWFPRRHPGFDIRMIVALVTTFAYIWPSPFSSWMLSTPWSSR